MAVKALKATTKAGGAGKKGIMPPLKRRKIDDCTNNAVQSTAESVTPVSKSCEEDAVMKEPYTAPPKTAIGQQISLSVATLKQI